MSVYNNGTSPIVLQKGTNMTRTSQLHTKSPHMNSRENVLCSYYVMMTVYPAQAVANMVAVSFLHVVIFILVLT